MYGHPTARLLISLFLFIGSLVGASTVHADMPASFDPGSTYVYVPPDAHLRNQPLQVVVAMHGMGGDGKGFCQSFLSAADRNGWLIVAPTFGYRNWRDPATVAEDDVALTRQLAAMLDGLPARLGISTRPRAAFIGFSRGAQLAHRFALAFPERTRAVAAMSAGTYTVPRAADSTGLLRFPFGTGDLESRLGRDVDETAIPRVPFWIAVGSDDARVDDVPRQWDALLGKTRVERAQRFAEALSQTGGDARLIVYPNVGHAMAPEMGRGATAFVEAVTGRVAGPLPMWAARRVPVAY